MRTTHTVETRSMMRAACTFGVLAIGASSPSARAEGCEIFFSITSTYAAGEYPVSLETGDLNGDGAADLVVPNILADEVSVLLGVGDGTFAAATAFAAGSFPNSVGIGDLDGDGSADLAVTNGTGQVSVLLGAGDGTFSAAASFSVGSSPVSIAIDDLDGDGTQDVVTASSGSDEVSVLLGQGDGTFLDTASFPAGVCPESVAIGDFNGDGAPDLVVSNAEDDEVNVLLGNGDGTFAAAASFPAYAAPQFVNIDDLNGDGIVDLAVLTDILTEYRVTVLFGHGDGSFGNQISFSAEATQPLAFTIGDVDSDGWPDLIVTDGFTKSINVMPNSNGCCFSPVTAYRTGVGAPIAIVIDDFDADGAADVATAHNLADASVLSVLLNQCHVDCVGDVDLCGDVGIGDLILVLGAWGTPDYDVTGDGVVDFADLLTILGAWGPCP